MNSKNLLQRINTQEEIFSLPGPCFVQAEHSQNFDRWQRLIFVSFFIFIIFGEIIFKLLLTKERGADSSP